MPYVVEAASVPVVESVTLLPPVPEMYSVGNGVKIFALPGENVAITPFGNDSVIVAVKIEVLVPGLVPVVKIR